MKGSSSPMDPQFEELAKHIADDVEKRFSKRFDDAEERLSNGARANMEELKTAIQLSAEGYGATLEAIDRRLELEQSR
jgi:DNA anti-recombination protein RmuC